MKSLFFIILSVLVFTSCKNDQTQKDQDQTLTTVKEVINSYNYNMVDYGYTDTITLVKIDTTIQVKNYPIVRGSMEDTSNVKVVGHTDMNLIVVTIKQYTEGYYKKSSILIAQVKDKKPLLVAFTSDESLITKSIHEFKLNDVESIKLTKQKMIDNEKYMSEMK
jgi:hypothetical protein